ncbi:acyl-homoserine-lactone synthase [Aliivibrio salmonicida]|uniref:acyl-homoserine-lactone synthase n=1 Tax=Aliivibrio salmonicida TaxID=40269 RepID=UPI003D0D39F9
MKESKKNLQHEFIKELHEYCLRTQNCNLLQHLISTREATILSRLHHSNIGNLSYNFNTPQATKIIGKQPCTSLPESYFIIEQLAMNIFGCLLKCRTELEIFKIINNSTQHRLNKPTLTEQQSYKNSRIINENYHYELVTDISKDQRYFHTEFSKQPLLLSDAIVLINIATFIKEHQWYEMLNHLDISSKGEHFILYQHTETNPYPTIISSALIQSTNNYRDWLFFDDFFQNTRWKKELDSKRLSHLINSTDMSKDLININLKKKTCSDVEKKIFCSILNKDRVCEAIRLTVSGEKSRANFHLYLAQKGLAMALKNSGRDIVFTIIEKPAMVLFYQAMNLTNPEQTPYVFTGSQDVNQTGLITYKGVWLLKNASIVFNQYNFKSYNVKIIALRKKQRSH